MPTHTHHTNIYVSMGGPGGDGRPSCLLVCSAGVRARLTVLGATRQRWTGREVEATTTMIRFWGKDLWFLVGHSVLC